MTTTSKGHLGALLGGLMMAGCGAGSPAAQNAGPAAPTSPGAVPGPPVVEAAAPPAEGLTRRYFHIHAPGDKDPHGGVPISIDAPTEWGVKLDGLKDPELRPCTIDSPVFGQLAIVSIGCGSEQGAEACLNRAISLQFGKDELSQATVVKSGPGRAWASLEQRPGPSSRIHARLFAVDEASQQVVMCVMMLNGKDRGFLADYKKACESLTLHPAGDHDEPPVDVAARPRAADGGGAPFDPPNAKALTETALGFLNAMASRDLKAARKYLAAPADCVEGNAKQKTGCKEYAGEIQKHLPEAFDLFPQGFQAGRVELVQQADMPGAVTVRIHPKGDDCAEGKSLTVSEINKKLVVLFAMVHAKK